MSGEPCGNVSMWCRTWVDSSNNVLTSGRDWRALPLRVNGDDTRRGALLRGGDGFAGECDDTTVRCKKLPSSLCGEAVASTAAAVTTWTSHTRHTNACTHAINFAAAWTSSYKGCMWKCIHHWILQIFYGIGNTFSVHVTSVNKKKIGVKIFTSDEVTVLAWVKVKRHYF